MANNILNFFPKVNDDQKAALEKISDFLESQDNVFLLKGYAGTGKTFLTKGIVAYLEAQKRIPALMAPTGRAARILSMKTGQSATTIHKAIYNLDKLEEIPLSGFDKVKNKNKASFKFRYLLNQLEDNSPTVLLVDEASMISDVENEGDFFVFGSGKLLEDLVRFSGIQGPGANCKIIFIGDNAQLPPVGMNMSPALNIQYLSDKFQISPRHHELTTVVRQQSGSGILDLATYIRNNLSEKNRSTFMIPENLPSVTYINSENVVAKYLENVQGKEYTDSVVINHSNKKCLEINREVRQHIFPGKHSVEKDDILIIHQNNYNYTVELLNGMIVKVTAVNGPPVVKSNMMSYNKEGKDVRVTHTFLPLTLEVEHTNGQLFQVSCMVLENFLHSPEPNLSYEENVALFIDFKMRHPNLSSKDSAFKDLLKSDLYFNALRCKFAYAITCHKAQGGEWENAIVNMNVSTGKLSDDFHRWAYTAVTRARTNLALFNVPHQDQFVKLNIEGHEVHINESASSDQSEIWSVALPEDFEKLKSKMGLATARDFQVQKFQDLYVLSMKNGFDILNRLPKPNHELYTFTRNGASATVALYYNKDSQFTKNVYQKGTAQFLVELKEWLSTPLNYRIISNPEQVASSEVVEGSNQDVSFNYDLFETIPEQLTQLYEEMHPLLQPLKIRVYDIDHEQYAETYSFERGQEKACLKFYYNGSFQFTDVITMINKCNSQEMLNDIYGVIRILKGK